MIIVQMMECDQCGTWTIEMVKKKKIGKALSYLPKVVQEAMIIIQIMEHCQGSDWTALLCSPTANQTPNNGNCSDNGV